MTTRLILSSLFCLVILFSAFIFPGFINAQGLTEYPSYNPRSETVSVTANSMNNLKTSQLAANDINANNQFDWRWLLPLLLFPLLAIILKSQEEPDVTTVKRYNGNYYGSQVAYHDIRGSRKTIRKTLHKKR